MEAMKMEQVIKAPLDIKIEKVFASEKQFVEAGQPLYKISEL